MQAQIKTLVQNPVENRNCVVKESMLQPLISEENPFFYAHQWNDETKTEIAKLDPFRVVTIEQRGCKRHHTVIRLDLLKITPSEKNLQFYLEQIILLMHYLYGESIYYLQIRSRFEEQLLRYLSLYGVNTLFQFDIDSDTFLCLIEEKDTYAAITLEIVRYVHAQRVQMPGVADYEDDAWYHKAE